MNIRRLTDEEVMQLGFVRLKKYTDLVAEYVKIEQENVKMEAQLLALAHRLDEVEKP